VNQGIFKRWTDRENMSLSAFADMTYTHIDLISLLVNPGMIERWTDRRDMTLSVLADCHGMP